MYFFAIVWFLGLGVSAWIISKYVNYRATAEYNQFLIEKNKSFAREIIKARAAVNRVSQLDSQLRAMLELKDRKGIIKYTGFGGPSASLENEADFVGKAVKLDKDLISVNSFEQAVRFIDAESKSKEKSFQEIVKYITEQRARLTAVPSGWPVKGWITTEFGLRLDPFSGVLAFHEGVDIANDIGTPVKATADGVVSFAGFERGYGNTLLVNHGNGYTTRFGHLLKYVVSNGQYIKKGQIIGYLGNSGRSTAPHLHYEVRLNGVAVNSLKYLNHEIALK